MSWAKVEPIGRAAIKERITVAVRTGNRHGNTTTHMEVHVGAQFLRLMGWERGQRVAILWGENKDFGWFRLEPQPDGFLLRDTKKSADCAVVLSTSQFHRAAKLEPHGSSMCEWRIREGGLEIKPPKWFWVGANNPRPSPQAISTSKTEHLTM